jgi:hypothetical protein
MKRIVWIVGLVGMLVLAGCGMSVEEIAQSNRKIISESDLTASAQSQLMNYILDCQNCTNRIISISRATRNLDSQHFGSDLPVQVAWCVPIEVIPEEGATSRFHNMLYTFDSVNYEFGAMLSSNPSVDFKLQFGC